MTSSAPMIHWRRLNGGVTTSSVSRRHLDVDDSDSAVDEWPPVQHANSEVPRRSAEYNEYKTSQLRRGEWRCWP